MKAWRVSIKDNEDQGMVIVFAENRNEARKKTGDLDYDSWLDIIAVRDKRYDDMEKLPASHLAMKQWRDGWQWYDMDDVPEPEHATDDEFIRWFERNF